MSESNHIPKPSIGLCVYRSLIRAYPFAFRIRFEDEMNQILDTYIRNSHEKSKKKELLDIWMLWIPDLIISVVSERLKELENMMKKNTTVSQIFSWVLVAAWIVFVGLTFARIPLHFSYTDPTLWLLGKNPSSEAYTALSVSILFSPFIALILAVLPFFTINRPSNTNEVAEIHILKAKGFSLVLIVTCFTIAFLLLALLIAVKFFNL